MQINLTDKNLTITEKQEIEKLLKRENQGLYDLEQDDVSMGHRHSISDWIVKMKFLKKLKEC